MSEREIQILLKLKDEMSSQMEKAQGNVSKASGKIIDILKIGVAGAFTAVGVAAGKAFADAFSLSQQAEKAQLSFQAQLGATEKEATKLTQVATDVWANNFGESLSDVQNTMSTLTRNFKASGIDVLDQDIQSITQNAYRLSDAFNIDVNESTRSAGILMQEFGLSSEQAFDFISKGVQSGLNASNDFLDTIGEYSNQFANTGNTAEEFFSILQTGMAGGVLGTDKVADSFKQFNVDLTDIGKNEVFAQLGIDQQKLAMEVETGAKSSSQAYMEMIQVLSGVEDVTLRNTLATQIFGTMAEDLTWDNIEALENQIISLEDMEGTTAKLDKQYNNFSDLIQGMWRKAVVRLQPFTDKLLEIATKVLPKLIDGVESVALTITAVAQSREVQDFIELLGEGLAFVSEQVQIFLENLDAFINSEAFQTFIAEVQRLAEEILTSLGNTFEKIKEPLGSLMNAFKEFAEVVLPVLGVIIGVIVLALLKVVDVILDIAGVVLPIIFGAIEIFIKILTTVYDTIISVGKIIFETFTTIGDVIGKAIEGYVLMFNFLKDSMESIFNSIKDVVIGVFQTISSVVGGIWNGFIGIITGGIELAKNFISNTIDNIRSIITNFFTGAVDIAGGIANAFKSVVNSVIDKINSTLEFSFSILGKDININFPDIPRLSNGGDFIVPPGFENDSFPILVESGERVQVTPANQVNQNLDNSRNISTVNIFTNEGFETFLADLAI